LNFAFAFLVGVHLILIGGIVQLVAGLLTFRKYDHLAGTTFVAFAALWSSYGATQVLLGASPPSHNLASSPNIYTTPINASLYMSNNNSSISESAVAGLVAYISVAFIVSFCSATVNYIMPFVFGAITLTLVFEAVGLFSEWALIVSGVIQLSIVLLGFYGAAALLLKGVYQRHVLPGFGNAVFDVLLLGAKIKTSPKKMGEEKKKNTKYAEPMALGNLCDVISPFIFAFYSFGYMSNFYVGAVWVSINGISQLLASYYAYLRDDVYYATKFGVHSIYWFVKAWEEFIISVLLSKNEVDDSRASMIGGWFFLLIACILCVMTLNRDKLELAHNGLFTLLTISTIPRIRGMAYYIFFGIVCSIYTALSLYVAFVSLVNSIAEKTLLPLGSQPLTSAQFQSALFALKRFFIRAKELPYSTTTELPDALFYICNGLAAISAIQIGYFNQVHSHLTIPWVLIPGALIQLYVSRIQVRGGKRFGPVLPFCYAGIWAMWTWLRFAGTVLLQSCSFFSHSDSFLYLGAIAFLTVNTFLTILAAYGNLVLLSLTVVMEVIIVCFLLFTLEKLPLPLEGVMLAIFSLICLYGVIASFANYLFGKQLIPMGSPLIKAKKSNSQNATFPQCPTPSSRQTSGIRTIASILDSGGVCSIPSDTVYTLAASCKHPKAIEKIYNIKERPLEKPICLTIGSLEQLEAVNPPFSPLLWEFMRIVYPGGIGCIVKKGEWLKELGVGPAYNFVGTKDSIMIRISDLTVTAHLLDMTGPLAITSANPSGEPDSIHHDMVVTRLGHKLEGVLCDGDSTELVSSTVVNCTRIDEGVLTFLREGAVAIATVNQIFERVK
uniref:Threonylcarbamoyl-AMP synthase n=1 Tax=Latimeria chalumnae TaxID=7897 RepID=H3AA72_LATCH